MGKILTYDKARKSGTKIIGKNTKKYHAKFIESTKNGQVSIWKIKGGYAVTRFSDSFSTIYKTIRGCKMTKLWQLHK
jgi:hypothetical protein